MPRLQIRTRDGVTVSVHSHPHQTVAIQMTRAGESRHLRFHRRDARALRDELSRVIALDDRTEGRSQEA